MAFHHENSSCNFHCWGSSPVDVGTIAHLQLEWFNGNFSFYVLSVMFQGDDFTKVWSVEGKRGKEVWPCWGGPNFWSTFFHNKKYRPENEELSPEKGFLTQKEDSLPAFFRIYSFIFGKIIYTLLPWLPKLSSRELATAPCFWTPLLPGTFLRRSRQSSAAFKPRRTFFTLVGW